MPRLPFVVALAAVVALALVQIATLLEVALIPAPTPGATGPQGPLDEALGLIAGPGGIIGAVLAIVSGVSGAGLASARGDGMWRSAIVASGVLAFVLLFVASFVLLGMARAPFHPFAILAVVPAVVLAYGLRRRREA